MMLPQEAQHRQVVAFDDLILRPVASGPPQMTSRPCAGVRLHVPQRRGRQTTAVGNLAFSKVGGGAGRGLRDMEPKAPTAGRAPGAAI